MPTGENFKQPFDVTRSFNWHAACNPLSTPAGEREMASRRPAGHDDLKPLMTIGAE